MRRIRPCRDRDGDARQREPKWSERSLKLSRRCEVSTIPRQRMDPSDIFRQRWVLNPSADADGTDCFYLFINSFAGNFGFKTFSAVFTPATGNVFASIRPSWANTDAWSQ